MSKTKNLKVIAMILLTTTLLVLASSASISNVKAATTENLVLYTTLGMSSSGCKRHSPDTRVGNSKRHHQRRHIYVHSDSLFWLQIHRLGIR